MEETKERFRITLAGIADAVISIDSREQIEFINPVAMQLLEKKEEQILGQFFWDIFQVTGKSNMEQEFIRKSLLTYGFYKGEDFTLVVNEKNQYLFILTCLLLTEIKKRMEQCLFFGISVRERK